MAGKNTESVNKVDNTPIVNKTSKELIENILADGKLDGQDLLAVEQLKEQLKTETESLTDIAKSNLNILKQNLSESTLSTLKNGFTISNEKDYKVLQTMLNFVGNNYVLPDYSDVVKYPEHSQYSIKMVDWQIYVYNKSLSSKSTVLKEIGKIVSGKMITDVPFIFGKTDSSYDNNAFSFDTAPDVVLDTAPDVVLDTAPDVVLDTAPDVVLDTAPDVVLDTTPDVVLDTAPDVVQPVVEPEAIPEDKVIVNKESTQLLLKGLNDNTLSIGTYKGKDAVYVSHLCPDGKIHRGLYTIGLEGNPTTTEELIAWKQQRIIGLEKSHPKKEKLTPITDNKTIDANLTLRTDNTPKREVLETREKVQGIDLTEIADSQKQSEVNVGVSEEKNFMDSTTECIGKTYDDIVQWISEYLVNFPDAGIIDLGNGETLEVEYDKVNNLLYVDTKFGDGIYDYKTEVAINITENMSASDMEKAISDANNELKKEYLDKIETVEQEKQEKKIKEVFSGNKKFTTVRTIEINGEKIDVRLVRSGKNNINLKLNTPLGDGVSDTDVTVEFAKIGESFENMFDLQNTIDDSTQTLEKRYKELILKK